MTCTSESTSGSPLGPITNNAARRPFWATLFGATLAGAMVFSLATNARAVDESKGVYRIPYANGTKVKVSGDHIDHSPVGRIDMHGTGGGTYKIVAAADGYVRYIEDSNSKQVDSKSGDPCTNNYLWIEHANGEWTKYSHMQKDSSTTKAKLKVGQFVKAGTYLGDEGKVGCASGNHLHFEVGVPRATDPIATVGGFLNDNSGSKRNRIPKICSISGGDWFKTGSSYTARTVPGNLTPGSAEVARHGLPEVDYHCMWDQAVNAGYQLEWVDGFYYKGKVYFNVLYRPKKSTWASFHGLTGSQYQQKYNEYTGKGYRPTLVESYRRGNGVRYAVIFDKAPGPQYAAYHGLSPSAHQARVDSWTKSGWRPKNISVVSINGNRQYTGLYEKTSIGSYQLKSFLTAAQYQQYFDSNSQAGRQLAYVNGYDHNGKAYFSAIWNSATKGQYKARHNLTSSQYQTEWNSARASGLLTRNVTGYQSGSTLKYAGVWRK